MNEVKKILFIESDLSGGGAERVLVDILRNIDYTRYEVDLLLIVKTGVLMKELPNNVRILSPNRNLFKLVRAVRKICTMVHIPKRSDLISLEYDRYDVIISFLEGISLLYHDCIAKRKDCLQISWIHTDMLNNRWTVKYFDSTQDEREAYQRMDRVICVSNEAKKCFQSVFDIPDEKLKVVYNPIDTLEIQRKSRLFEVRKEKFTIGFVGRLTKQAARLIRVARLFMENGYDIAFWFLGDGGLKSEMELLSQELQVEEYCTFWGFQDNPYPYIKEMDIYVNPSDVEGFSLTVCESFCLGCAVVATSTCGPVELLDNDRYGLLVDFDDASIYQALKSLIDDQDRLHYYQQQALERSRMFDIEQTMKEIYSVIDYKKK